MICDGAHQWWTRFRFFSVDSVILFLCSDLLKEASRVGERKAIKRRQMIRGMIKTFPWLINFNIVTHSRCEIRQRSWDQVGSVCSCTTYTRVAPRKTGRPENKWGLLFWMGTAPLLLTIYQSHVYVSYQANLIPQLMASGHSPDPRMGSEYVRGII